MLEYFLGSYIVTIAGLAGAYFWGEHVHSGSGFACVFIALVLGVLEVSLSFDNAVVNAMKLEKMSNAWRHRFLTWGILIAVFGMRFLFPILVVSIFSKLKMLEVAKIQGLEFILYVCLPIFIILPPKIRMYILSINIHILKKN